MRLNILFLLLIPSLLFAQIEDKVILVIHGGAGSISADRFSDEKELEIRKTMEAALLAGFDVIKSNGSSQDAVVAAIQVMEEDTNFNSGRGAVFTHEETNELDASIMEGKNLNAGGVAGVQRIKSPIQAAQMVMNESGHVLLSGDGAELFAKEHGLDMVDPDYFFTTANYEYLLRLKSIEKNGGQIDLLPDYKFGTVGAVALDLEGNLAAGTSTGGMTNKRWGRIGDSPIIGAGTYANNNTCAVSCTGWGEYFIKKAAAFHVSALIEYAGLDVQSSTDQVIKDIYEMGASGGIIALNTDGQMAWSFSTKGMFRAFITENGHVQIEFYSIQ